MHGIHVVSLSLYGLFACTVPSRPRTNPGAGAFDGATGSQTRGALSFRHFTLSSDGTCWYSFRSVPRGEMTSVPCSVKLQPCQERRKVVARASGLMGMKESQDMFRIFFFFCYFSKQNRLCLLWLLKDIIFALKNIWCRIYFEIIFTLKILLLNFTNETASKTLN